jgi:FkbM family methyltransferase
LSRDDFIASPLPHEAALLRLLLRDAPLVIFDIDSCEGEDSLRYARVFPSARIWAIEPLPSNVDLIRANLARYGVDQVEVVAVALSDSVGHAIFHVSSGRPDGAPPDADWDFRNKSSSLLPPSRHLTAHPWVHFDEAIEVETDRLDALAGRSGLTAIDYIHLRISPNWPVQFAASSSQRRNIDGVSRSVAIRSAGLSHLRIFRGRRLSSVCTRAMSPAEYLDRSVLLGK